jgi:hypothetical protein
MMPALNKKIETCREMAARRARAGVDLGLPEFPWEVERAAPETEEGKQEAADGYNYSIWGYLRMMRHRRLWAIAMSAFEVAYTALALIEELEQEGIDEDQGDADSGLE